MLVLPQARPSTRTQKGAAPSLSSCSEPLLSRALLGLLDSQHPQKSLSHPLALSLLFSNIYTYLSILHHIYGPCIII